MYENVKQNQVTEKGTEIRSVFAYGEQAGTAFGKEVLLRIVKMGTKKPHFLPKNSQYIGVSLSNPKIRTTCHSF